MATGCKAGSTALCSDYDNIEDCKVPYNSAEWHYKLDCIWYASISIHLSFGMEDTQCCTHESLHRCECIEATFHN